MRLLVRMSMPFSSPGGPETFECVVQRVVRAGDDPDCEVLVWADVDLPLKYRVFADARHWNQDGTYRVEALVRFNRRSLAAFIASGEQELDCSEDA